MWREGFGEEEQRENCLDFIERNKRGNEQYLEMKKEELLIQYNALYDIYQQLQNDCSNDAITLQVKLGQLVRLEKEIDFVATLIHLLNLEDKE